jgi:phosphoadenosine phosphosulfate reductase
VPLDASPSAQSLLGWALSDPGFGRTALVSSFGAESVVLLHMVSEVDPATPVLFLDTEMLFPETLAYQEEVAETLGLTGIRRIGPAAGDPDGTLHRTDPDACCALRKTEPLERALEPFDAWITGRKRYQGGARRALPLVEPDGGRLKINPLAAWSREDVGAYMGRHALPRHPLVAKGYPSIGCAPCTTPVSRGEDERAGRWRGTWKDECGIHFENGRLVRRAA